jgi:hypothetical protein
MLGLRLLRRDAGIATLGAEGDDAPLVQVHERRAPHRGRRAADSWAPRCT